MILTRFGGARRAHWKASWLIINVNWIISASLHCLPLLVCLQEQCPHHLVADRTLHCVYRAPRLLTPPQCLLISELSDMTESPWWSEAVLTVSHWWSLVIINLNLTYFDLLWHIMTYYDLLWLVMTYFDLLWLIMTCYDLFWLNMTKYLWLIMT